MTTTDTGTLIPCVRIKYDGISGDSHTKNTIEMHCFEETYADGYSNTDVYVIRFTKIALHDIIEVAKKRGIDIEFIPVGGPHL